MAYKLENFIYDLETYIKANLNTKLTEINAENSDSLLSLFDASAYFVQTLDDRVTNWSQFVFIQAGNPALDQAEFGGLALTYPIGVYLMLPSDNLDEKNARRIFRFAEALQDVILSGFWSVAKKKFKVQGVDAMALVELNATRSMISTGITLEASFG